MSDAATHVPADARLGNGLSADAIPHNTTSLIEMIGRAIDDRERRLEAFTSPHPDEDAISREARALRDALARLRPGTAREAIILAAETCRKVREIDEVGGCLHVEACQMTSRLLEWAELAAGTSADAVGVGRAAKNRDLGPVFGD